MEQYYALWITISALRLSEHIHLPEQFFDPHARLLPLAAEFLQFLTEFVCVGYRCIAFAAEGGDQFHGAMDTLFKTLKNVQFIHMQPLRFP